MHKKPIIRSYNRSHAGFTIVELLIVIVVIGILASLILLAFNNTQQQARMAKARSDIKEISKMISLARIASGKTLAQITGNEVTDQPCVEKPTNTDLAALPKTDACWTTYYSAINAIQAASGTAISSTVDPWGRPYLIDENEGVNGDCRKDTVAMFTQPFVQYSWGGDSRTPDRNVPLSGITGCKSDPYD